MILLVGGGFWLKKRNSFPNSPQKSNNNSQRELAQKIKDEITEELKNINRAKTTNEVDEVLVFGYKLGGGGSIIHSDGRKKVLPVELKTADFQEIVNLIGQEKKELAKDKIIELRKKIAEKLTIRPDLFYWPVQISKTPKMSDWYAWSLFGKENRKDYNLIILRVNSALTNISFEDCKFYQITGAENIPLAPSNGEWLYKIVKPENQITIKLLKN